MSQRGDILDNKVQQYRWEQNLSLKKLSLLSGVSISEISKIENKGVRDVTLLTAYRLSKALKVDVWDLFIM